MSWSAEHPSTEKISPERSPHRPAFARLPVFYATAILRPVPATFARIAEYARWPLVWFQLLLLVIVPIILGVTRGLLGDRSSGVDTRGNVFFGFLDLLTVGQTIIALIAKILFVPIAFFVGVTLQFVLCYIFGGRGRYLSQAFAMLTYQVPLMFIGCAIILLFVIFHFSALYFAPIISVALFFYGILINMEALIGVHRLTREKALTAIFVPYLLGFLAVCGALATIVHSLARSVFRF